MISLLPVHWFDSYYVVADLGEGAYAVVNPATASATGYLIVGRGALLFDTGPGIRHPQGGAGAHDATKSSCPHTCTLTTSAASQSSGGQTA
jgi:hypothetical protein